MYDLTKVPAQPRPGGMPTIPEELEEAAAQALKGPLVGFVYIQMTMVPAVTRTVGRRLD